MNFDVEISDKNSDCKEKRMKAIANAPQSKEIPKASLRFILLSLE
jgi:hypothetical protein